VSELSTPADVAAERARHGSSDAAEDGSNDACASHDLDQRNAVGRWPLWSPLWPSAACWSWSPQRHAWSTGSRRGTW